MLRGQVEKRDPFGKNGHVLHLQNGMLHLDHDPPELRPFSPDYLSRNRSPIAFDEKATCPRFQNELLAPALPEDDIDLLQRYAGMALMGVNRAQRVLVLSGTAGGGKGAVVNVVESVIGIHNVAQLRTRHLGGRFETGGYVGKTLLTGKDVDGDFLNQRSASVIKALCGNDRLDVEIKGGRTFQIVGNFCIIIASNSRLTVHLDGDTEAWRRRLMIIEYSLPPVQKAIPGFDGILVETEGQGILNWMIEGAVRLLAELDTYGSFRLTPTQQKRVDSLLSESDSIREFVQTCVAHAPGADATVSEMVQAHAQFCTHRGWGTPTVRRVETQITDVMMELHRAAKRHDVKRDGKSQRGFSDVSIREDAI